MKKKSFRAERLLFSKERFFLSAPREDFIMQVYLYAGIRLEVHGRE